MTSMKELKNKVSSWATTFPSIRRVWLFGSHAKNTCHAESDIDLAIEIDETILVCENALAHWIFESDGMAESLQKQVNSALHLQHYDEVGCPHVFSYVSDHGILLYDKADSERNEET